MNSSSPPSQQSKPRPVPSNSGRTLVGIPAVKIDSAGAIIETARSSAPTVPLSPAAAQRKSDSLPFAKTLIGVEAVKVPQSVVAPVVQESAPPPVEEPQQKPANHNALPSYDLTERVAVTVPMAVQPEVEAPVSKDYSIAREPSTPQPLTQPAQHKLGAHWKLAVIAAIAMGGAWYGVSQWKSHPTAPVPSKPETTLQVPVAKSKADPAAAASPQEEIRPAPPKQQPEQPVAAVGDEQRASHLVSQGNAFRKKKMFPMARVRYLESLEAYPGYVRALSGLVQLSLATHRSSDAVDYARQLVKAQPENGSYQLQLGDALHAAKRETEANAAYQEALRLGNKSAKQRLR